MSTLSTARLGHRAASLAVCIASALASFSIAAADGTSPPASDEPPASGCTMDNDCKGDRVCDAGACRAPVASPAATEIAVESAASAPAAALVAGAVTTPRTVSTTEGATPAAVLTSTGDALKFTFAPPPKYAVNLAVSGLGMYADPGATLFGGGSEIAVQALIGLAPFPDSRGGNWHGFRFDGYVQALGGGILLNGDISGDGIDDAGGFFAIRGGLGVGYAYLHMRDIDLDFKQRGIGISGGWRIGDQKMWTYFGVPEADTSIAGVAHGPSIQLLFPTYNAHRGLLDYKFIGLEVTSWSSTNADDASDSVTILTLSSGGTF